MMKKLAAVSIAAFSLTLAGCASSKPAVKARSVPPAAVGASAETVTEPEHQIETPADPPVKKKSGGCGGW
jgi:hypothetical protein